MENKVRVRFAPSPTGPLHIGGVRTALFNYLFAKKHHGDFLLRIEDTDQTRFVPGAEQYIIDSLSWCGILYNEGVGKEGGKYGPYRQSDRKSIYKQYADQLINSGNAYYAFDTPEALDMLRKQYETEKKSFAYDVHTRKNLDNSLNMSLEEAKKRIDAGEHYVIRFKMPENTEILFNDMVRGEVKFNTSTLDDKVLFKSDGMPTYHLANVTDDYLMKITHVIRGEEWLPSTPLHILLYRSLGWENAMPIFAHLPLILKPSGQGKLSKRDGDKLGFPVFPIQWQDPENGEISSGYRESGYFSESVINILAFLGWNPGTEQEFFTLDELVAAFSIDKVQKAGARFDPEKAKWFNQHYLKTKDNIELAHQFLPVLQSKNHTKDIVSLAKIIGLIKERATFVTDFWAQSFYFFEAPMSYDQKVVGKYWKDNIPQIISQIKEILVQTEPFNSTNVENSVKKFIEEKQFGMGQVMNSLRLCIVGTSMGPHLFDILELLGKEESVSRLEKALSTI